MTYAVISWHAGRSEARSKTWLGWIMCQHYINRQCKLSLEHDCSFHCLGTAPEYQIITTARGKNTRHNTFCFIHYTSFWTVYSCSFKDEAKSSLWILKTFKKRKCEFWHSDFTPTFSDLRHISTKLDTRHYNVKALTNSRQLPNLQITVK